MLSVAFLLAYEIISTCLKSRILVRESLQLSLLFGRSHYVGLLKCGRYNKRVSGGSSDCRAESEVQIGLELKVWGWSSRGSGRLCIHSSLTCIHQHQPLLRDRDIACSEPFQVQSKITTLLNSVTLIARGAITRAQAPPTSTSDFKHGDNHSIIVQGHHE